MSVGMPGYNASGNDISVASSAKPGDSASQMTTQQMTMTAEGDAALPEQVAYVPVAKPRTKPDVGFPIAVPAGAETIAGNTPQPLVQPGQTAE
ncbi:MAG: peptidase M15A, partial [Mesorhizobium sp.]